ncbi:MAG: cytochrome P450 [Gordonia sp. (in: high G+C Gram-positive bacteria)]
MDATPATPLHVAMFSDFHPDSLGGIAVAVADQCRELRRRGHRVTLVTPPGPAGATDSAPWLVTVPPLWGVAVNGFPAVLPAAATAGIVERALARRGPVDVVHVHTTYGTGLLGVRIARRHRLPLIQTAQSRDDTFLEQTAPVPVLAAGALRLLHGAFVSHRPRLPRVAESRAARHAWTTIVAQARAADLTITPTHHFAAVLRRHGYGGELAVISNGIDDALIDALPPRVPRPDGAPLRALWCGRISAEKRPLVAVEAAAATPGVTLDLVGDGDQSAAVADRIAELGAGERIRLLGRTDRATVLAEMTRHDVLVFTSVGFDTQGLVLVEAAAAGLPIVYCDPDLAETVPAGAGFAVADPSPAALAATLTELAAAPDALAAARTALTGMAVRQSQVTDRLIPIYRRLAAGRQERLTHLPPTIDAVPVAPGRLPALGHSVTALRGGLRFIAGLRDLGPVVRLDLGTRPAYLLTTPDLIRQVGFRTAGEFDRDDLGAAMHEAIRAASNVLAGEAHDLRRRQIAPTLRQGRLARYAVTTAAIADDWAGRFRADATVDLPECAHELILETVTSTLFNADFGASALERIRATVPWLLGQVIVRGALPAPVRRLRVIANRRFARESAELRTEIGAVVARYRAAGTDRGDVLSALVAHTDEQTGPGLTDDEIVDELLLMVAAGVGSTASILAWVFYEVARDPGVAAQVDAEVARVVGAGPVRPEHVAELTYLRRVVTETLRMWGPWISSQNADGPVTFGADPTRRGAAAATDELTGQLTLPDGAMVIYSPYLVLHDPRYYPDPETFDPDRWAPGRAEHLDRHANLAFGVGERHCPGNTFAMQTILIACAALYSRWRPEPAGRRTVRASTTDFVASASHLRMRMRPRPHPGTTSAAQIRMP